MSRTATHFSCGHARSAENSVGEKRLRQGKKGVTVAVYQVCLTCRKEKDRKRWEKAKKEHKKSHLRPKRERVWADEPSAEQVEAMVRERYPTMPRGGPGDAEPGPYKPKGV